MNEVAKLFNSIGEPFAAGMFEEPERSYFYRYCLATARYFEALAPVEYSGEDVYPYGNRSFHFGKGVIMHPHYALTYTANVDDMKEKNQKAGEILEGFMKESFCPSNYTHSAPNYKRIIKEGLDSYRERVKKQKDKDFCEGLLNVLDAVEGFLKRCVEYLKSANAKPELIAAMENVPFKPAKNYYEGLVAWNLIFFLDGCDNLGYIDNGLAHLYNGEDYTHIIAQLFYNLDSNHGWSCTIGGAQYNEITKQAMYAIRKRRRPMLELRVAEGMPEELWDIAMENYDSGITNPAFYNEKGIHDMLKKRFPHIPDGELAMFVGCGCTETNLQGMTRAGGVDDNIPLALIFEKYMNENLSKAKSFEEFYEGLCSVTEKEIDKQLDEISEKYYYMSKFLPNPLRTIFTDDCIDKGKDFNAGGARYTWTESSENGLINVVDSLLAIRELVFRKKMFTPEEFLQKLSAEDSVFYETLKSCPCFGVDDDDADMLATDYAKRVYNVYRTKEPKYFIDAYIMTDHQFERYGWEGKRVGPTPDGRKNGAPTGDSIGALRGKAIKGPTAMLKSAAKLPQEWAEGISVLNLTVAKNYLGKPLQSLVESYFKLGGIQVQITCTSPEVLKDAMINPDKHKDLIVRIGGYSDYFVTLPPELQQAIYERNIHELG